MAFRQKSTLLGAVLLAAMCSYGEPTAGLKDTVVLVIRHAEKPPAGRELSPEGYRRAEAYVKYFAQFQVDSKPLKPDSLFAAADSKNSQRPRLTLEPLSRALHVPLETSFKDKAPQMLADTLKSTPHGREILICWHHGKIPDLLRALGADAATLLPGGTWPDNEFGWIIQLRYDSDGHIIPSQCRRIEQNLAAAR